MRATQVRELDSVVFILFPVPALEGQVPMHLPWPERGQRASGLLAHPIAVRAVRDVCSLGFELSPAAFTSKRNAAGAGPPSQPPARSHANGAGPGITIGGEIVQLPMVLISQLT